jgi:hypothetical protein
MRKWLVVAGVALVAILGVIMIATIVNRPNSSTSASDTQTQQCLVRYPEHDATIVNLGVNAEELCNDYETTSFAGTGEYVSADGQWNPTNDTFHLSDGTNLQDQCIYRVTYKAGSDTITVLQGVYDDGFAIYGSQLCSSISKLNGVEQQHTASWKVAVSPGQN